MSFDPCEFLQFAKYLATGNEPNLSDDAKLRTIISRAYYAAYHVARQYAVEELNFEDKPTDWQEKGGVHKRLLNVLEGKAKGNKGGYFSLTQLLKVRIMADYDLEADLKRLQDAASGCIPNAEAVIKAYSLTTH